MGPGRITHRSSWEVPSAWLVHRVHPKNKSATVEPLLTSWSTRDNQGSNCYKCWYLSLMQVGWIALVAPKPFLKLTGWCPGEVASINLYPPCKLRSVWDDISAGKGGSWSLKKNRFPGINFVWTSAKAFRINGRFVPSVAEMPGLPTTIHHRNVISYAQGRGSSK